MKKLITFAVPSYNSQDYLKKCVDSLLAGGEEVEILIVNDGSHDNTGKIADEYAEKYPSIVRAIHKENGGHGSGVNRGLREATGLYYKVVDSDDWLDRQALERFMATLKEHVANGVGADMYIANFVYDHVNDGTQYVSEYTKKMPVNEFFGWEKVKPFHLWKMLLMHSVIYRTETLKQSGVCLPEHTFYVDNLFVYQPMPFCKTLFYMDVNLYHYYIGRSDQSVTMENIVKRYEQQIRVTESIYAAYRYDEIKRMTRRLQKMLFHAEMCVTMNTIFFTSAIDTAERREALKRMWKRLKERDGKLYRKIRYRTMCALLTPLPYRLQGFVTRRGYKYLCKHVRLGDYEVRLSDRGCGAVRCGLCAGNEGAGQEVLGH